MIEQPPHISASPSLSPRASICFAGLFLLLMLCCTIMPRAQSFLPGLLGVGALLFLFATHKRWPAIDRPLLFFALSFGGLCALSALWALDGAYVLERALKQTGILLSGVAILSAAALVTAPVLHRDAWVRIAALCCALVAIFFFFESYAGFTIARILMGVEPGSNGPPPIQNGSLLNRGTVFLVLLLLPILLAIYLSGWKRQRKIFFTVLIGIGMSALLYATESQTAQMAALMALLMILYPAYNKFARRILLGGILLAVFVTPFLPVPAYQASLDAGLNKKTTGLYFKASIPHRLEVWNFVGEKIAEKPLLGHGMEAIRFLKSDKIMPMMKTDHVLHPHNAILQVWVEFGLLGGLLSAALVFFLFWRLETQPPLLQRYYAMLFCVLLVILCTGYGLWQSWQLGMLFSIPAFSMVITRLYPEKFAAKPF